MAPRLTLKTFLSSARAALTAPSARQNVPLTFVVGNESADLDSLCSAVVCAYFRSHSSPHVLHIPLSNLRREDLALRTEMTAVLRHAGLVPDDLLTLSELPPDLEPEEARWFLVDHNALTGGLKRFQGQVVGVVDHHVDEMVTPEEVAPRVIEPCGSCTSLVVEEYRSLWDSLKLAPVHGNGDQGADFDADDERLAKLSLAPILIDTLNMTETSKVKEKDVRALAYLKTKIRSTAGFDQTSFFDEISAVKEDISGLSFRDILRKDYKEWEENGLKLGISCAVQNFDFLLGKEKGPGGGGEGSFLASVRGWAVERQLDVASVMTVSHLKNPDGEFQRHLLVWGFTMGGVTALWEFPAIARGLGLETWRGGLLDREGARMAWRQWDLTSSRKQVAPLLREALKAVGPFTS